MARKTWQTAADWQAGIAENLEITDAGVKLARPEPAQFSRSSPAYLSDGTLIPSGQPRYEGAGVLIEEGTSNLIPLAKQKFEGWTAYQGAAVTLTQGIAVPEWGAVDATRIRTSGGAHVIKYYLDLGVSAAGERYAASVWLKNNGDATVRIWFNLAPNGISLQPGEARRVCFTGEGNGAKYMQLQFIAPSIADSLDFIAWRPQIERKSYCTSWTDGTRSPESLSVPVPFTPQEGGSLSFKVEVNDACKRQVAGLYPRLLTLMNALGDGNFGLALHHAPDSATFGLQSRSDDGRLTSKWFADDLIPNGLRELEIRITSDFVTLYCDGQPIAQIGGGTPETKPKLPSGWGRAYLGSRAAGTNQAGTTVGNLRMVVA